ncbi:MAG: 1-(5-phosphoribosyl)-5-[(5-phosphoribosylamino)methylideneamino]imidazole-4-carboxamide isomerase [Rickettsiales bacterium]|nr:1-(5-phosphoribosyl)-5-[(5-phosphoribosylamino)methylideneamino]imidazole-4-carboxamide isomerase [Rickettsiales bacterium]
MFFPAIDLKKGKCVRLFKGEMDKATVFNDDPAAQAKEFEALGFKYLHIVDLDGAIAGDSRNEQVVKNILQNISIPAQLGGGIRTLEQIEKWLNIGISRVILGTIAAKNPDIVIEACKKFPGHIVVGLDAKNGFVATEGWVETSEIKAIDLAKKYENAGVEAIIYTDISKDGTLTGPNIEETKELAQNITIPVIASGGISCDDDIIAIKNLKQFGVIGAIVGRALYDKKVDIKLISKTS